MVERCTWRDKDTNMVFTNTDSYSVREKLERYESTGMEPEEIKTFLDDMEAKIKTILAIMQGRMSLDSEPDMAAARAATWVDMKLEEIRKWELIASE